MRQQLFLNGLQPRHLPAADLGATQDEMIPIPTIIITEPPSVEVPKVEENLETTETTPIPNSPLDVPKDTSDPIPVGGLFVSLRSIPHHGQS